ncbi:MAG: hypothetical protein M3Q29_25670 [Chloroflexota bacterium]|nr:hypothetical protein [Chloroflexota bacterium]
MTFVDPNLVDTEPNPVDQYMPEVDAVEDTETGRDPDTALETNPDIGLGVVDADENADQLLGDAGPGGVSQRGQDT